MKPRFLRKLLLSFTAVFLFLAVSCTTTENLPQQNQYQQQIENEKAYLPEKIEWKKLNDWSDYFVFKNRNFPVIWHLLKIDLTAENLEIRTYPCQLKDFIHKNGKITSTFTGKTTKAFAKETGVQIAVNSTPFTGKFTLKRKSAGIHKVEGMELSAPVEKYGAITFTKQDKGWKAQIVEHQKPEYFADCDFAFGGFFPVLKDGIKKDFSYISRNSRTAAGISNDGKTFYLLVIEGERKSKSIGLSYPECADILIKAGASEGLQLDGGGSTSLIINGQNTLSYPSLRKNGGSFGFINVAN